jgi:hypothetical protein
MDVYRLNKFILGDVCINKTKFEDGDDIVPIPKVTLLSVHLAQVPT